MGLFLSRNVADFLIDAFLSPKKISGKEIPRQIESLVSLVSARTGRHKQRYNKDCRLVVGCIPYRCRSSDGHIEVLMISSQNGKGMLFPKGGWEDDESMKSAASRETLEEAGVIGNIECVLGKWNYKSKSQSKMHEAYMFPCLVKKELDNWPEKHFRRREWLSVEEAREVCPHSWMKEALEVLVSRQKMLDRSQL